jgi:hypothetical protein
LSAKALLLPSADLRRQLVYLATQIVDIVGQLIRTGGCRLNLCSQLLPNLLPGVLMQIPDNQATGEAYCQTYEEYDRSTEPYGELRPMPVGNQQGVLEHRIHGTIGQVVDESQGFVGQFAPSDATGERVMSFQSNSGLCDCMDRIRKHRTTMDGHPVRGHLK